MEDATVMVTHHNAFTTRLYTPTRHQSALVLKISEYQCFVGNL